jgi:hypothetical protein
MIPNAFITWPAVCTDYMLLLITAPRHQMATAYGQFLARHFKTRASTHSVYYNRIPEVTALLDAARIRLLISLFNQYIVFQQCAFSFSNP